MALSKERSYTLKDIYALPDGLRAELIDGQIYNMSPPNTIHQKISWKLHQEIGNYISAKGGNCDVYAAPFAVFLNNDYVEPDLSVVCDRTKLNEKGCIGAPDWIVNPMKHTVTVYDFEHEKRTMQYSFDDTIPVCIYEDFRITIAHLL